MNQRSREKTKNSVEKDNFSIIQILVMAVEIT